VTSAKETILKKLAATVGEGSICADALFRNGVALAAQVPVDKLRAAVSACAEAGYYLETITALDFEDTAELVYHLNCYEPFARIALRVLCSHAGDIPSITEIFPSAQWHEREVHDFFGITFPGNDDLRALLLPEDADYHPLQKSFGKVNAYRNRKEIYG
jgi:NADH-quinone oxidoreductase subunit C